MLQISQPIAIQRWDTLPDILREALFDDRNTQIVEQIAAAEHLSDDKRKAVSRIAGYVMMGFLHPEDTAQEIKDATGVDSRIAGAIAGSLNSKIFSPLRGDIDKIYTSPPEKAPEPPKQPAQPVMLGTEQPTLSGTEKKPSVNDVLEKIKSIPTDRVLFTGTTPPIPPKSGTPPKIAPQPINLPITEKEPSKPVMPPPKPFSMGSIPPPIPTPTSPTSKPSTPPGMPATQAGMASSALKPSTPGPVMLHQEVSIAPTANPPVLHSGNLVSRNLMENKPKSAAPPPPPPMAHLEFENKEGAKPRIVNYSAENVTLPSKPSAPMPSPTQRAGTHAATPITPPKIPAPPPANAPAISPKAPMPVQNSTPAKIPAPPATPVPGLTSISPKPIFHTLDLSPKPPPPPKTSV